MLNVASWFPILENEHTPPYYQEELAVLLSLENIPYTTTEQREKKENEYMRTVLFPLGAKNILTRLHANRIPVSLSLFDQQGEKATVHITLANNKQAMSEQLAGLIPSHHVCDIHALVDAIIAFHSDFLAHPNEKKHHAPDWHYWGIEEHTLQVVDYAIPYIQQLLTKMGIRDAFDKHLDLMIDGKTKRELFAIAMIFHDIGKYDRNLRIEIHPDGRYTITPNHDDHEVKSAIMISGDRSFVQGAKKSYSEEDISTMCAIGMKMKDRLGSIGLTDKHIDYIATIAAVHYDFGRIRAEYKNGWKWQHVFTVQGIEGFRRFIQSYPEKYRLEMLYAFILDNLGKWPFVITDDVISLLDFTQIDQTRKALYEYFLNQEQDKNRDMLYIYPLVAWVGAEYL